MVMLLPCGLAKLNGKVWREFERNFGEGFERVFRESWCVECVFERVWRCQGVWNRMIGGLYL